MANLKNFSDVFWNKVELRFKSIAGVVDLYFHKYKFFRLISCIYFDITSRITNVLLNKPIIFYFLCFSNYMIVAIYFGEIRSIVEFWKYERPETISPILVYFFWFLSTLFDMVVTNTILVQSVVVRHYMIEKYGEGIFKERGYNSITKTLQILGKAGSFVGFSYVVGSVLGSADHYTSETEATKRHIESEIEATKRYQTYVDSLPSDHAAVPPEGYFARIEKQPEGPTFASKAIK